MFFLFINLIGYPYEIFHLNQYINHTQNDSDFWNSTEFLQTHLIKIQFRQ